LLSTRTAGKCIRNVSSLHDLYHGVGHRDVSGVTGAIRVDRWFIAWRKRVLRE
jgi:hypothetical protein